MGRLYLDATGNYSDPTTTTYKYLRADGEWATPDMDHKWLDAAGEYTVPELFVPPEDIVDASWEDIGKLGNLAAKNPSKYKQYIGQDRELTFYDPEKDRHHTGVAKIVDVGVETLENGGVGGLTFWMYKFTAGFSHRMTSTNAVKSSDSYANSEMKPWLEQLEFDDPIQSTLQRFKVGYKSFGGSSYSLYTKVSLMASISLKSEAMAKKDGISGGVYNIEGKTYQYFTDMYSQTHSDNEYRKIFYHYCTINSDVRQDAWLLTPYGMRSYMLISEGGALTEYSSGSNSRAVPPSVRFCIGSSR